MLNVKNKINADLAAGLLFAAFGAWFCAASFFGLKIGTAFRMGPGFFPTIVGGLLLLVGLIIALNGWRTSGGRVDWGSVPWRAVVLIPIGLVVFGFVMRPLGLLPALLVLSFLAALSVKSLSLVHAALLSVAVTAVCVCVFSFALGINLPLLGDWLR